jgi:hypothetical protein
MPIECPLFVHDHSAESFRRRGHPVLDRLQRRNVIWVKPSSATSSSACAGPG